jgi:transcriptional/translational regulatory protein YebC/TACO1
MSTLSSLAAELRINACFLRARFTPTAYLFSKKAIIRLTIPTQENLERLWEVAIELGAEDIINLDEEEELATGKKSIEDNAKDFEVEVWHDLKLAPRPFKNLPPVRSWLHRIYCHH